MASLTVQALVGLGAAPTVAGAAAGGDTTDCDPDVKVRVVIGGTATVVTRTFVGPFVGAGIPAKVSASLTNVTLDLDTWEPPGGWPGSYKFARCDITYSQVTGVSVGAATRQGV